jgi:hypothetical protein
LGIEASEWSEKSASSPWPRSASLASRPYIRKLVDVFIVLDRRTREDAKRPPRSEYLKPLGRT